MSAFSRLFALALFFVALILAENTVISRPLAGRLPRDNFSGASGPSRGGDAQTPSSSSSTNNCINGSCEGLVNIFSHNGGNGGLSKSGDATNSVPPSRGKQCKRRRANDDTNAYSGAAGDSSGGTGSAGNSMINIFSGNGGNGGESVSGKSGDC
ncbi:hypothetical protein GGU10DRAFT_341097 [Lentinula aff. detonsa]|uniref:Uncharacterized protein n=1 Tax=Lentinula aff. detonsa TaxID=2804958 RepID=A0AA38NSL5_9AGAR|nr:hypothetical protein GGU10DRAFT_341097 [Lentinula aff. detonsa]